LLLRLLVDLVFFCNVFGPHPQMVKMVSAEREPLHFSFFFLFNSFFFNGSLVPGHLDRWRFEVARGKTNSGSYSGHFRSTFRYTSGLRLSASGSASLSLLAPSPPGVDEKETRSGDDPRDLFVRTRVDAHAHTQLHAHRHARHTFRQDKKKIIIMSM